MRPELPFLAAGTVAITGGIARDRAWPKEGLRALVATLLLITIASASANTRLAPLVRAIGFLTLMIAVIAAVPAFNAPKKKGK